MGLQNSKEERGKVKRKGAKKKNHQHKSDGLSAIDSVIITNGDSHKTD